MSGWFMTLAVVGALLAAGAAHAEPALVKTKSGILEGSIYKEAGLVEFKGVPYAAPPVGSLRWKAPQPAASWSGVRKADRFGGRPMQVFMWSDMKFRSEVSEDCLYLNIWAPQRPARSRKLLPVLVYFFGGGFVAGDGSEYRYDGASMAQKGIISITVNYRLGIFGFFAHPDLSAETAYHGSGNYGLMDQSAAIQWVYENIKAFGGDPKRITIGGESAGSFSVSAQMASPMSRHMLAGAIGESGAMMGRGRAAGRLADAERNGLAFAASVGAKSLAELRAIPAQALLEQSANKRYFGPTVDGHFLPKSAQEIYEAGEQAHIPLLAGWNSYEGAPEGVLGQLEPTSENFEAALLKLYPERGRELAATLPHSTKEEVLAAAAQVAGDRFVAYGTWKWIDLQAKTGGKPVYRYWYAHPRPGDPGAWHASEIDYALGNLRFNDAYKFTADDHKVSDVMLQYFANFVKTGSPNGRGLPNWPVMPKGIMHINVESKAQPDRLVNYYKVLDSILSERPR